MARCAVCGNEFWPDVVNFVLDEDGGGWLDFYCPYCGTRYGAEVIIEEEGDDIDD